MQHLPNTLFEPDETVHWDAPPRGDARKRNCRKPEQAKDAGRVINTRSAAPDQSSAPRRFMSRKTSARPGLDPVAPEPTTSRTRARDGCRTMKFI
jgi:hypothetical protein